MNVLQIWGVVVYALFTFVMTFALFSLMPRYVPGKPWPRILFVLVVFIVMVGGGYLFGWYVISGLRME